MTDSARLQAMAQWLWQERQRRLPYRNLPDELRPASIAEAYAAQEAGADAAISAILAANLPHADTQRGAHTPRMAQRLVPSRP